MRAPATRWRTRSRPIRTWIACPTLLVTGDEDAIAPPQAVRLIGERIAGARVEMLPRCGHWTTIEKPEECNDALQRFYARRCEERRAT